MNDLLKQLKLCNRCGYQHAEHVMTPHFMLMASTHHIHCKQCGCRTKEKKPWNKHAMNGICHYGKLQI
jgi:C4-type Zn-finger protein